MDINQESIFGSFLPNVYITKITLNDDRVELSLMIKENIEDDEELSYLNSDFLKEFIKISIIQSTEQELTDKLADNFLVEKNKIDPLTARAFLNLKTTKNLKISYDEEGNREIYYDYIFSINTVNLQHLAYFVFCEINEQEIRKKFKLNSSVRLDYTPSKITNEIVIENGEVSEESHIYLLPDGSLWAGAVRERRENEYVTVEPIPRSVQKNIINNYKVQDFRSRNIKSISASSIQIDNILSAEGEEILNSSFNKTLLKKISNKTNSCIYDVYHSFNSDKTVTINFKIDFSEVLKQYSPFPSLVNENSTYEQLNDGIITNTEIINAKLYRRQVKSSINKFKNISIDVNEPEMIIFSGIPEEVNIGEPNKNIKQYYITDLNIKDKISGEYQYYISFEIKDGIISFLRDKLNLLIENYSYLKNYYNSSMLVENYDRDTDSFSSTFSTIYPASDIADIVNTYISTFAQIYNIKETETDKLQNILSLFVSPSFGNPKGILYFVSLYDNLVNKISQYVSLNDNINVGSKNAFSSKENIILNKEFNEVININLLNCVRLEYFPIKNGNIDLSTFRERIKLEIEKFSLDNTNIYDNKYSTCYLSPSKIYLENKEIDLLQTKTEQELSLLRSEIQCLNNSQILSKKILNQEEEDQKARNFFNLRNILSNQGITFDYIKVSGSSIELDDLEFKNTALTDVESQNSIFKIDSKIYDSCSDIDLIFNSYYSPNISLKNNSPNHIIKFKDLSKLERNLNSSKNLFNYGLIGRIEYNKNGEWFLLTDTELDNNIKEAGTKTINCRIKKYAYSENGVSEQKTIKYIYNEYFSISLDTEITDNFITTSVPVLLSNLKQVSLINKNAEMQIQDVLPKMKNFKIEDGSIDSKQIKIKGNNFKKDLEVYIFKDKIDKNNLIFTGSTKIKNGTVSLVNSKEIRIKFEKIQNYKNILQPKQKNLFSFERVQPQEINTIIVVKDMSGNYSEYNNFKLFAQKIEKKKTSEQSDTSISHFDNKDKINSIMDIGLGIKKKTEKEAFDKTILDDIVNNNNPIGPKDLVKDRMKEKIKDMPISLDKNTISSITPKRTSAEINVKNISSNSKTIILIKEQTQDDISIKTEARQSVPRPRTRNITNKITKIR